MAQRKSEEQSPLDQVLKLVDTLSLDEQKQLRLMLNAKAWGEKWDQLVKDVAEDNKDLPPISEEEIYAEFTEHRREQRTKRAQSSS
jgi:hypothetical protein